MNDEEKRDKKPMAIDPVKPKQVSLSEKKCDTCACCKTWRQIFAITKTNMQNELREVRKIASYYRRQGESTKDAKKTLG